MADPVSASAACLIGSQATVICAAPGAITGSIGVYTAHEDVSAALAARGVKVNLISAGKHKTEGNALEPLGAVTRAHMRDQLDEIYGMFVRDVALGRRVPVTAIRAGFGQGRALLATEAHAAGLVDGVATLDQVVARMRRELRTGMSPTAMTGSQAMLRVEMLAMVHAAPAYSARGRSKAEAIWVIGNPAARQRGACAGFLSGVAVARLADVALRRSNRTR